MNLKKLIIICMSFSLCFIVSGVVINFYLPIKYNDDCDSSNRYRYKLGIYEIDTLDHEITYNKVGGLSEFLNIEKVKCKEEIELEHYLKIKASIDSANLALEWKHLKCGLWINKNGDIGLKDSEVIGLEGQIWTEYYITHLGYDVPLKDVIDTLTFRELGSTFYKDKKHIYHFYAMAYGGTFNIYEEADYNSFIVLNDFYAKDKNSIYEMRKGKLDDVDYATFRTSKEAGNFAKDKYGYFQWGDRISKEDLQDPEIQKGIKILDKLKNKSNKELSLMSRYQLSKILDQIVEISSRQGDHLSTIDLWSWTMFDKENQHLNKTMNIHPSNVPVTPRTELLDNQTEVRGDYLLFDTCPHIPLYQMRQFEDLNTLKAEILSSGGILNSFTGIQIPVIQGIAIDIPHVLKYKNDIEDVDITVIEDFVNTFINFSDLIDKVPMENLLVDARKQLQTFKAGGMEQKQAYAILFVVYIVNQELGDQSMADFMADVMDFVSGHCQPEWRIWPNEYLNKA